MLLSVFSWFTAQAVYPSIPGGLLRCPGRQLQGAFLHSDQPLQHGQADHLALRLPLAAWRSRRAAAWRKTPQWGGALSWPPKCHKTHADTLNRHVDTNTDTFRSRCRRLNKKKRDAHGHNSYMYNAGIEWKHACRHNTQICLFTFWFTWLTVCAHSKRDICHWSLTPSGFSSSAITHFLPHTHKHTPSLVPPSLSLIYFSTVMIYLFFTVMYGCFVCD